MMSAARAIALAVGVSVLAGCMTPVEYGPIGGENGGFGYSDTRNADGSYTIRVVLPYAAQSHEFWDRRATELCGGPNYRKIIYRAHIPVVTTTGYAAGPNGYGSSYTQDVYGAPVLEGYARCNEAPTEAAAGAVTEAAPAEAAAPAEPATQP